MGTEAELPGLIRLVPHTRPLLFHEGKLFCGRFDEVLSTVDYGRTFVREARIESRSAVAPLLRLSPLARRVTRSLVYRMRVGPDGARYFLFPGGVYVQLPGESTARLSWTSDRGRRPVSLAVGRDGLIAFGEYWRNPDMKAVRIFGSRDGGRSWQAVVNFAPGEVRHVHGISYDPWEDCFWVCTGDYLQQNRLLRASPDFREMTVIRQGGQENRYFSVLVLRDRLLVATDCPDDPNVVCMVDKRTGERDVLAQIQNSSFFSCLVGSRAIVSTNAEPSAVNDTGACHVWVGSSAGTGWRCAMSLPVDGYTRLGSLPGLPSGLFQYPQIFFAEGDNPGSVLVCQAVGLDGLDDAMLCLETSGWG